MTFSRLKKWSVLAALVFAFGLSACTYVYTANGAYYRVKKGDTVAGIAARYKMEPQTLAEANNIQNDSDLQIGRAIYIPGATPTGLARVIETNRKTVAKKEKVKKPKKGSQGTPVPEDPDSEESVSSSSHGRFDWPVEGELSSLFGMRKGRHHDGVDIRAKQGVPIMAADSGEVVYSKRMRGYGNLVLVEHRDGFFTVYAHNSVNLVKVGAKVKKGQVIAKVGRTGRATGPHLHFEVRDGTKVRNPLFFLPQNIYTQKALKKGDDHGRSEDEDS